MAVEQRKPGNGRPQHWVVGANVGLMIGLAVILAAAVQYVGYRWSQRVDLTSTGINSLTESTTSLLRELETPVKLTSLYYKTDIEDEDQDRYRTAVHDLINLYRSTNRSKITVEEINPLQEHEKRKQLFKDLLALPKFKEESAGHVELVRAFQEETLPQITTLISAELERVGAFTALQGQDDYLISQVRNFYSTLQRDLNDVAQDIADAMASEVPMYGGATSSIRQIDSSVKRILENIIAAGDKLATAGEQYSPAVVSFFTEAKDRYASLLQRLKDEEAKIDELPALSFDEIVRDLRSDTGNSLLVTTDQEARVVPFHSVWPLVDPRMPSGGFANRKFQGEQKLTSAILQLTQKEKPAVVFVRHGGAPLLTGGFMPGQPQPTYAKMKANLEDANFAVYEWDLAASDTPPELETPASRTLYVVLRPQPASPSMPGQPPQSPPFTPQKLEALKNALGESPRALFIAGFMPSMGGFPASYEFADFLRDTWGIDAPCDRVLLYAEQISQGKYHFVRNPLDIEECRFADDPMTAELGKMQFTFPLVSPITLLAEKPEGVTTARMMWTPYNDGLWSVGDVSVYVRQQTNEFIVRDPNDLPGEFTIGVSATKGDGKVVVISSNEFATDMVALAPEMALTSQGLTIRPKNPGNAALFINALHWLNDNVKWMNLGTPIDTARIAVKQGSGAMKFVWALCVGILPLLAMGGGLCVWFARRR